MKDFISKLPKAELHVHIEGTFEPELKFEIAKRNHVELPYRTVEECVANYTFTDLPSFLKIYYESMRVLLKEEDFYDLAYAYFKKARSQNVLYAEVFFDPQAHTSRGVEFKTVISGLRRAQEDAKKELGINSQLIMCFLRDMTAESAMKTLEESLPFKKWIVGVGLDSDEKGNPPVKFREVFIRAKQEGYRLTMHCDVNQEGTVDHHWQCLNEIGVERIDHGVNSLDEETLWMEIRDRKVALTVCPVSNSYVTDGVKGAEIKSMLDKGMKVTVNSDDPAYFLAYMNENFEAAQKEVGLTPDELCQLSINAFECSWLSDSEKATYIELVKNYKEAEVCALV